MNARDELGWNNRSNLMRRSANDPVCLLCPSCRMRGSFSNHLGGTCVVPEESILFVDA